MKKHETATRHTDHNAIMESMHQMNKKMEGMKMTGNTDHDFAEMMILHHQAAIDMARLERASGNDAFLKNLSSRIIEDQTKEINELQQWLQKHNV